MTQPPPDSGLTRMNLATLASGHGPPSPELLWRSDGQALLYPGAVHAVSGEPGCGKSWLALAGVAQVVRAGGHAVICDYEDTASTAASRLLSLGIDPDAMERVSYFQISGPVSEVGRSWLVDLVARTSVRLVVLDSVAESLAAEGCSENDAVDVSTWMARLPRLLAHTGVAVLLVDHVTKDAGSRGRWARGSGAKLATIGGAAYLLSIEIPFSRTASGIATLRLAKDRHGAVGQAGLAVATVRFVVTGGSLREIVLDPPAPGDNGPPEHTGHKECRHLTTDDVVAHLKHVGGRWSSVTEASRGLGVSREAVAAVLDQAVRDGAIEEERGRYGARCFRLTDGGHGGREPAGSEVILLDSRRDGRVQPKGQPTMAATAQPASTLSSSGVCRGDRLEEPE